MHAMFGEGDAPYDGRHYRLGSTALHPRPLRRPPIMVGGAGERKTLRLVAKHAEACNLLANPKAGADAVARKLEVLRAHCEREGTDYDAIAKTVLWSPDLDPADGVGFAGQMQAYADVGVSEVHVMHLGARPVEFVRELGRSVVPRIHDL
jgi:alkanesulfonate monooxygenase SsuD/methylene tetrahydromethanopterin reductase-like flavin-dependent oxidoreductase (luciferase family)